MLATATLLGVDIEIPSWVPEEDIAEVQEKFAAVTFNGSQLPV
jgi:hypothetical protein